MYSIRFNHGSAPLKHLLRANLLESDGFCAGALFMSSPPLRARLFLLLFRFANKFRMKLETQFLFLSGFDVVPTIFQLVRFGK